MCVCVCVFICCMHMYMQMHVHLEARGQPCVLIFKTPFTLSSETGSLTAVGITGSARLAGYGVLWVFLSLSFQNWGYKHITVLGFLCGFWGLILGLQTCIAIVLLMESSSPKYKLMTMVGINTRVLLPWIYLKDMM